MWFARERVRTQDWAWPTETASQKSAERLKDLLDGAFRDVSNEKGIVAGACVATWHSAAEERATRALCAPPFPGIVRKTDLQLWSSLCGSLGLFARTQEVRRRAWPCSTPRRACSTPQSELPPRFSPPILSRSSPFCCGLKKSLRPTYLQPRRFWVLHPAPKGDRIGPALTGFIIIIIACLR